jgi:hypothetical protein
MFSGNPFMFVKGKTECFFQLRFGMCLLGAALWLPIFASCALPDQRSIAVSSTSEKTSVVLQHARKLLEAIEQATIDGPLRGFDGLSTLEQKALLESCADGLQIASGNEFSFFAESEPGLIDTASFVWTFLNARPQEIESILGEVAVVKRGRQQWYFLPIGPLGEDRDLAGELYLLEFRAFDGGEVQFLCASIFPGTKEL